MGQLKKEVIDHWGDGVITSMEPDVVPPTAYVLGKNTSLTSIGGSKAAVKKREGIVTLNATAITGSTAVVGVYEYRRRSGSSFVHHHLAVSDNGRLDEFDPDTGDLVTVSATAFTSSSSQERPPSFATANNLCFIVNGTEQKKYNGTALQTFGIEAPGSAPTIADAGDSGNHNGTYEARVTFYNNNTGQESSAGATSSSVAITNSSISWSNIPTSADSQVTHRRLYLRNTGTMSNFYLVGTVADNVSTTTSTNTSDGALTEIGPDTEENNPPPSDGRYVAFHKSRLFVATSTDLHYSKLQMIESFDPEAFETPNPDDGQQISGIISAFDSLVVFKTNSIYVLVDDDPDVWFFRPIPTTFGCVSFRSIVFADGKLYWWSEKGPIVWSGAGSVPELMGQPFISETISVSNLSYDQTELAKVSAANDLLNDRILFSVPEFGKTRNTLILPWSYRLSRWESDGWDPMDAATIASIDDGEGQSYVALGNYGGQLFRMNSGSNDGIISGTNSGTFTAGATSISTITDGAASFLTSGAGLKQRKVTIVDSNGVRVEGGYRPYITANTGTELTLSATVTGLQVGAVYTYFVGGPAWDWESAWLHQGDAFLKKRYQFAYIHFRAGGAIENLLLNFYTSYDLDLDSSSISTSEDVDVDLWDESDWDEALWDGSAEFLRRYRIGATGTSVLVRLRNYHPDVDITLLKVGVSSELLTDRIG